jgi:hypothetical protein
MKTANVLLGEDGEPFITVFGLAKQVEDASRGLSKTGDFLGTLVYSGSRMSYVGWDARLLRELGMNPEEMKGPVKMRYIPRPGSEFENLSTLIELKEQ